MNKVILIGNITKDVETRQTANGISCASFTVAVSRKFKNADGVKESDFINIVAWRQLADICSRFLSKGSKVAVTGSLQTRSYQAQDGSKRYITEVVADDVEFLSAKGERQSADNAQESARQPVAEMAEVDDGELPF